MKAVRISLPNIHTHGNPCNEIHLDDENRIDGVVRTVRRLGAIVTGRTTGHDGTAAIWVQFDDAHAVDTAGTIVVLEHPLATFVPINKQD